MAFAWTVFGLLSISVLFKTPEGKDLALTVFSQPEPIVLSLLQYWGVAGLVAGMWSYVVWNNLRLKYRGEELKTGHAGCIGVQVLFFGGAAATRYYDSLPLPEGVVLQAWFWRMLFGAFALPFFTQFTLRRLYAGALAEAENEDPFVRCPTCGGSGWISLGPAYYTQQGPCPACKGSGVIETGTAFPSPPGWPLPDVLSQAPSRSDQLREQENYKAVLAAQAGDFEQAETIFSNLCDRYPDWASPKINLANVLVEIKQFRRAEGLLWEAWDLTDDENEVVNVLVGLGNASFHQRRYTKALDFFKRALDQGGEASDVRFNMGLCLFYLGRPKEAADSLDRVQSIRNQQKLEKVRFDLKQFDYADPEAAQLIDQLRHRPTPVFVHEDEQRKHPFGKALQQLDDYVAQQGRPVVFFAGAGISLNAPSNVPVASRFLLDLFELLYGLDQREINAILADKAGLHVADASGIYQELVHYIFGKEHSLFPFEPTFQRLETIAGPPVLSFVETLREGAPNYHHFMLAASIKHGHTVVTTNFDDRIEQAFSLLYPGETIRTVVTDLEFQQWLDRTPRRAALLKIHGSLDNYGSLALTAQGIWATSEFSMQIGADIDAEKAEQQRALSHDESSLSIPKDLALSRIMDDSTVVFMGYSGSDIHDISPIVFSRLAERRVVWLSYEADLEKLPRDMRKWLSENPVANKPLVVKPDREDQKHKDIVHATSSHWKLRHLQHSEPFPVPAGAKTSLSYQAFCDWLQRMSFRKGDGLAFLGEFFENNGHFELALACYEGACRRYADTLPAGKKERRLLHTENRLPFCMAYTGREAEADKKQLDFIRRMENEGWVEQFADLYVTTLLETADRLARSGRMEEGKKLWQKGRRFSEAHGILHGQVFAESIEGTILYEEGKVREALEHFLHALNGCSILGSAYGESRAAIAAAQCFRDLGNRFDALRLSGLAHHAAKKSGDRVLEQMIETDRQRIRNYYEFNHHINRQASAWEDIFTGLMSRIGASFRRFRFLLASRDFKGLDALFGTLDHLPGLTDDQKAAIRWHRIIAALEAGQKANAQDLLLALRASVGALPLLELELYRLRQNPVGSTSDLQAAFSSALDLAELHLLETRPAILRAKQELETALENLCRKRDIDFAELMGLFEQMKVERAGELLDQLSEVVSRRDKQEGELSIAEATIIWHRSLLYRRMTNKTRDELLLLEKLTEALPDNILFQYNAGVAAMNLDRFEAAKQYLEAAYRLSGNNYPLALCSLGLLCARQGDKAQSREYRARLEAEGGSQHSLDLLDRAIKGG